MILQSGNRGKYSLCGTGLQQFRACKSYPNYRSNRLGASLQPVYCSCILMASIIFAKFVQNSGNNFVCSHKVKKNHVFFYIHTYNSSCFSEYLKLFFKKSFQCCFVLLYCKSILFLFLMQLFYCYSSFMWFCSTHNQTKINDQIINKRLMCYWSKRSS